MEYTCSVCAQKVDGDLAAYVDHTEQHVIDLVKHEHPEWVEEDGMCQKCLEYYRAEIQGTPFHDAPCALRTRKVKRIFGPLLNLFKKS